MFREFLIRMARAILQRVLSELMQVLNIVREQALAPMRMMVQQVTGGIGIGQGANAFVEEVSSLMIPGVGKVMDQVSTMSNNLRRAQEIIDQADQRSQSKAVSLGDVFGAIY